MINQINEVELATAKALVQDALSTFNNNTKDAMDYIFQQCEKDPKMMILFAKVGHEIITSASATKH